MDVSPAVSVRSNSYTSNLTARFERSASAVAAVQGVLERVEAQRVVNSAARLRDEASALRASILRLNPMTTLTSAAAVGSPIALDPSSTAATLVSAAEINTDSAAFTPRRPLWSATSTSQASFGGTYDGSLGTTSLTVTVINPGERGVSNARVEISDDASPYQETFNIHKNDPLSEVYTLGIGIELTLGAGSLDAGDTLAVSLQTGVDVKPDPNGTFDASAGTDANLENGLGVTAGSFTVNGEVITVAADDSISSVLDRINASDAGVSASYDAASERISFVQQTLGAAPTIVLDSDTSGFLAAMKLDGAVVAPGTDPEKSRPIDQVAALSGVSPGNFLINGVQLALDPSADSIVDVIASINAGNTGVTAELLDDAYLIIRPIDSSALELDSNGTGLFEAFGISSGAQGEATQFGPADVTLHELSRQTRRLVRGINDLLDSPANAAPPAGLETLREQLLSFVESELTQPLTGLGLTIGLRVDDSGRLDAVSPLNEGGLQRGFRWHFDEAVSIFAGSRLTGKGGALEGLIELLQQTALGPRKPGSLIDEFA